MRFITLETSNQIKLYIRKIQEKYISGQQDFSCALWINKNTSEILDPLLYSQFNNAVVGNHITIDKSRYLVKEIT